LVIGKNLARVIENQKLKAGREHLVIAVRHHFPEKSDPVVQCLSTGRSAEPVAAVLDILDVRADDTFFEGCIAADVSRPDIVLAVGGEERRDNAPPRLGVRLVPKSDVTVGEGLRELHCGLLVARRSH
jgi:hypothetical protein